MHGLRRVARQEFFVQLGCIPGAPVILDRAVSRDRRKPAAEGGGAAEQRHLAKSSYKDVLHEIFGIRKRHTRKKYAVHHARVPSIEFAEGGAIPTTRVARQALFEPVIGWRPR